MLIKNVENLIKKTSEDCPLKEAYDLQDKYYSDFLDLLKKFESDFTNKDFKCLIKKFQFSKKFDQERYVQIVSEISILYYILLYFNNKFKYEPTYNGGYNPECAFVYMDKEINLEVKCPNLQKRLECEKRNTLKIFPVERLPNHIEIIDELKGLIDLKKAENEYTGIEEKNRLDNKLKDFLLHSQKKFPESNDSNFNILAISLNSVQDFNEWYIYMFGDTGVFTKNTFLEKDYDNIDAILLTTIGGQHREWKDSNGKDVWNLKNAMNLLLLNPNKKKEQYYLQYASNMFGSETKEFLSYLNFIDKEFKAEWTEKKEIFPHQKFCEYKLIQMQIVTRFLEYQNKNLNQNK